MLTKNCASYVASMINKALSESVAERNSFGIYTPRNIYKSITPVISKDMPVAEGDQTRLARLLPDREKVLNQLKKQAAFKDVDFKSLEDTNENPEKTVKALEKVVQVAQATHAKFSEQLKKDLKSLIYSYSVDRSLYTQKAAVRLYKEIFKLFYSQQ